MLKKFVFAAALLFALPALAQERVDQLGAAAAISAGDTLPTCQSCGASTALVKATFTQIMTFIKAQANTWSAAQTFTEVHENQYAPTPTSNNYTLQSTDCGKTLLLPTATTPTLTTFHSTVACTIVAVQMTAAQYTITAASGDTVVNVNSFTKTKGLGAIIVLKVTTPSGSAATWTWSGDGA